MAIMAAGMHDIWIVAGIGKPGCLLDRQRIHIGTNADPALASSALQRGDNTCSGDTGGHFITPGRKMGGNQLAGAAFLKGKLRILVQIVAKGDDLVEIGGDAALYGIIQALWLCDNVHGLFPAPQAPTAFPRSTSSAKGPRSGFPGRQDRDDRAASHLPAQD
jgi:hypothetical protein